MAKQVVAAVADFPPGTRRLLSVGNRPIVVFNIAGEFFALFDKCPHQGGSLCEGKLIGLVQSSEPGHYSYSRPGEILRCPWHGWEFDLRTGLSRCEPEHIRARNFPVTVESGSALPAQAYALDTIPVTVEQDYVVIDA
jgi:nitrite reductase/ring-hydroxylating ferredoxin subunit